MLSGGVAIQAILSAANFIVGLFLIRRSPEAQYGYYVLIATAVLLSTTLQGSFIAPAMILRLTRADREGRADLVGSLMRDQNRLIPYVVGLAVAIGIVLGITGRLSASLAVILAAGTAAVVATLRREFFRMVLFAYRCPNDVLKSDFVYCVCLVVGAYLATLTALPAAAAALTVAVSSLVGGSLLSKALWRHEAWNPKAPTGMLRKIGPLGAWSSFGGGVHWLFSQGYNYVVAGALDVTAVAALAATRLLIMPVGLLSTGIGSLMLPTVSRWTNEHGAKKVFSRLVLFAAGLAATASCYLLVMWLARDWIFAHVLKRDFAHRDLLLSLWVVIALVQVIRDQLLHFLVTRAQFRLTASITLCSAVVSFAVSLVGMRQLGVTGALLGLLTGEVLNVAGIVYFSVREARQAPEDLPPQSGAAESPGGVADSPGVVSSINSP
jgi:O-antigen/teichoic acid export membrane protein